MNIIYDTKRALEIGAAGEHLVCADLLLGGYRAFQAAQGSPYDVVAECGDRLFRVTVKSTTGPRPRSRRPGSRGIYQFAVGKRKRDSNGKTSATAYKANEVDIVALVALDSRIIAYVPIGSCPTMLHFDAPHGEARESRFGPPSRALRDMSAFTFERAVSAIGEAL